MTAKSTKVTFTETKKVVKIDNIDVIRILVSKEEPYGTKNSFTYFIGYNDNDFIRPLCIKLPQITGYVRKFEDNLTMSFKISDKQLLQKYNQIWEKVEKLLKVEFDGKPVCGDNNKYIKTKIKMYNSSMITNFQDKKMPKEKVPCRYLSIIMVDYSNILRRMQIWTRKDKNGGPYWWWCKKKVCLMGLIVNLIMTNLTNKFVIKVF